MLADWTSVIKLNNTSWVQCYLCWTHWGLMCVAVCSKWGSWCMPQGSDEQLNPLLGQRFKGEQCYKKSLIRFGSLHLK